MVWIDVAAVTFACVMAIHLGLVDAVLGVFRVKSLPIVTCPKCLTWWLAMAVCLFSGHGIIASAATSFLCAYIAIWYDLLLGYLDTLYEKAYKRISSSESCEEETGSYTYVHDTEEHIAAEYADAVSEVPLSESDFE